MESNEYKESTTVRFDWTIRGLKQLFESSKGETKSKALKSVKFGDGRWQILFYPNSGTEGGQFVSLYLSCEPTSDEKDSAINGRWVRTGQFKFNFELRNTSKTILFSQKEAVDHSFSWKTANWGWAQFARRDAIYYQPNAVRNGDSFIISCTISSSPIKPSVPSRIPHRSVPKDLLDVVGSLLDDPAYSDVEFILPGRRINRHRPRTIFAARSILMRAEYFRSMFGSGFAEASLNDIDLSSSQSDTVSVCDSDNESPVFANARHFEDSDDEDEVELTKVDRVDDAEDDLAGYSMIEAKAVPNIEDNDLDLSATIATPFQPNLLDGTALPMPAANDEINEPSTGYFSTRSISPIAEDRNVHMKLSHPSSPHRQVNESDLNIASGMTVPEVSSANVANKKHRVVVRDVAYTTYRAVLYYLYTDSINFAPLASTFLVPPSTTGPPSSQSNPPPSQGEGQNVNVATNRPNSEHHKTGPTTRLTWIREWERQNPRKPAPCSAKATYRVADKLGLSELKERAFQHIVKSLTIHNVPYEMFSSFSSIFDDVRKTQINFFLEHWNEIRASQSMQSVWQQIRAGRHPGFEEVWPLIATNLEFRPRVFDSTKGDFREGNGEAGA